MVKNKFFCHYGLFCPFTPLTTKKIKILKKWKKLEIFSLYKSTIKENHMNSEIRSATDRTFSHFGPFFALSLLPLLLTTQRIKILKNEENTYRHHHFTLECHKWPSYDIWFLRYEMQQTEFFCHLGPFFSLPLTAQKMKNSKKW